MLRAGLLVIVVVLMLGCQAATPSPFACTDEIGCVSLGPDEPVKIATLHWLESYQEDTNVANLAAAQRNNMLLGHPIILESFDELCSPEGGANAALRIVSDPDIIGILGTTCSGAAVTASEIMSEAGLVMISGSNTNPSLTSVDGQTPAENWQPGYYRTADSDTSQGQVAAWFAYETLGLRRAATIDDGDTYTAGLAESFQTAFTELGGDMVYTGTVNPGDEDMAPVLMGIATAEAEFIFLSLFEQQAGLVVQQARDISDLADVVLLGGEAVMHGDFLQVAGDAALGVYIIGAYIPDNEAIQAMRDAYVEQFNMSLETPIYLSNYDAANLLLDTIEAVAIQEEDGTLHIGRQALRDALYATEDYPGLSGSLTCDQFGDCGVANTIIVQVDDITDIDVVRENVVYRTGE